MNLRALDTLIINRRDSQFVYAFKDGRTVTHDIQHDHLIDRVAALCQYAGADIETLKEGTVYTTSKMNLTTHGIPALLQAISKGEYLNIHGAAVSKLLKQNLIKWDGVKQCYVLTKQGATLKDQSPAAAIDAFFEAQAGKEPTEELPPVEQPPSDDDVTPESAPAQKFYVRPMTPEESREFYAAREKYYAENGYQTTSVTVPRPSATELKLRKASYKAIRDGLTNALTGGRSLIPVLDGLEATDPYLSGTDKDGPR